MFYPIVCICCCIVPMQVTAWWFSVRLENKHQTPSHISVFCTCFVLYTISKWPSHHHHLRIISLSNMFWCTLKLQMKSSNSLLLTICAYARRIVLSNSPRNMSWRFHRIGRQGPLNYLHNWLAITWNEMFRVLSLKLLQHLTVLSIARQSHSRTGYRGAWRLT